MKTPIKRAFLVALFAAEILVMPLAAANSEEVPQMNDMSAEQLLAAFVQKKIAEQRVVEEGVTPEEPEPVDPIEQVLDAEALAMTFEQAPISSIFYTIAKQHGVTISVNPDVTGKTLLRFQGGTVRELVNNILENNDLYMERKENILYIKKSLIKFYHLEYPHMDRSSVSTTSITLTPATVSGSQNSGTGGSGNNSIRVSNAGSGTNDNETSTSLTINEKSRDTFWDSILNDIKAQLRENEKIIVNPFSGIVSVETTHRRHSFWEDYFSLVNHRINAQVHVEVTITEVTLNDDFKFGIDWSQAMTQIGGTISNTIGVISTALDLTKIGPRMLPGDTIVGNFQIGKLNGVFKALSEQGKVDLLMKPSIRLLNNQKGVIKVGDDQSFWSRTANVDISNSSTSSQTTSTELYSEQRQTFGIILPVTAQIGVDGWITLIIEPARTRLNRVDTSPDGKQNSPNTYAQTFSTVLRLRSGEGAIIGGLNETQEGSSVRKIPLLGDIPYLGKIFQSEAKYKQLSELVVTVSATIIE